jgi:hypothetical protein
MGRFANAIFFLIISTNVQAEYRAYQLQIDGGGGNGRQVISTLDQYQYPVYNPLNKGETIKYVDSWMCYENMSHFQRACTRPERKPAASAAPNPIPKAGKTN